MRKHLTLPPPSFQAIGVQIDPAIEAVVRHALEKDVAARTQSVGEFLVELRNAVNATPDTATPSRDTAQLDPNRTLVSPLSGTNPETELGQKTNVHAPQESGSGLGNKTAVADEGPGKVTGADAYKSEQEARERAAREELAREAEARREAADAVARTRKADEERLRREREKKEERERLQREQLERVARQASDLEERLARLSTSLPPAAGSIDPEATQLHGAGTAADAPIADAERGQRLHVAIPPKPRNPAIYAIAAVVALLFLAGAITAYVMTRSDPIVTDPVRPSPSPTAAPKRSKPIS